MKNLSTQQIERLYQFTREHYVEYYDVQTELVDHLASAIESQWLEEPDKDFKKALQAEFKKFGVFGFMSVVEKRQKTMHWHYLRLLWKETLLYLKLPKILLMVFTVWCVFLILTKVEYGADFLLFFSVTAMVLFFIISFKKSSKLKKAVKSGNKKLYLLEETLLNTGQFFGLVFIPIQLFASSGIVKHPENFPLYIHIGLSLVLTMAFLMIYIMLRVLPSKKESILKRTYPEMNIKNV